MRFEMKIEAFKFNLERHEFLVLDQTKLPVKLEYVPVDSCEDGFRVIKDMLVRGAPCIAAVACLSLLIHIDKLREQNEMNMTIEEFQDWFRKQAEFLAKSRPTAVNLNYALLRLGKFLDDSKGKFEQTVDLIDSLMNHCIKALNKGLEANMRLGDFGFLEFKDKVKHANKWNILTHCNTGSLATVGYGTALGVIRTIHKNGKLEQAFCTETRPYNQGSRLTAWELEQENIPATLISDNMVAYLMAVRRIDGVVVGADRVVANGDTANKIGTLQIAVTAKYYNVPFYVAAPTQSIDMDTPSGANINIEQRHADELRKFGPHVQLAPDNINVWNPCFDVTPSQLISGFITEYGLCRPNDLARFLSKNIPNKTTFDQALF